MIGRSVVAAVVFSALTGAALAECPGAAEVEERVADFLERRHVEPYPGDLDMASAMCAQAQFVARLDGRLGARAGYKAGFASRASQAMFNVDSPARGVLFADMLLPNGATVPADFGARPLYEADLLVRVGDEAINDATTALEAAAALESVIPFIELPDVMYAADTALSGPRLAAINMGARLGVLGPELPVEATPEFLDALAAMTVTMTDETGATLVEADGRALLDHPMNVVLWLIEDLRQAGERLRPGDILSLGSFGRAYVPEAGKAIAVTYAGLGGTPAVVTVRFE